MKRDVITITKNSVDSNDILNVVSVLNSGKFSRGDFTDKAEKKALKIFKAKNAILAANGTGCLLASLAAFGVKGGDEIITTPFSFVATTNAILMCNAKPVFVDIDEQSLNIDTKLIKQKINAKTIGILPADLFGLPCDYNELRSIAKKNSLFILADSCQATGAKYNSRPITEFVDVCVHSFFDSKTVTSGEGGLILTNNTSLTDKINIRINHGQVRGQRYGYQSIGFNYRPTDIQSALIFGQLDKLRQIIKKRIDNAHFLIRRLKNIPGFHLPIENNNHTYERFVVRITKEFGITRKVFQNLLKEKGIQTDIQYPKPLHFYSHIKKLGYKKGDFPVSEKIVREVISLPMHSKLNKSDLNYIAKVIKGLK